MKVGLKNCVDLVEDLVDCFDFAVNESCNVYNECDVSRCLQFRSVYFLLWPTAPTVCCSNILFQPVLTAKSITVRFAVSSD